MCLSKNISDAWLRKTLNTIAAYFFRLTSLTKNIESAIALTQFQITCPVQNISKFLRHTFP